MFGKWKNLAELRRGVELGLTMSLFGIPEVLVVHVKYDSALVAILNEMTHYKVRLVVLVLDPDNVCEDCASVYVRSICENAYPGASSVVNVKYFGIPQKYVNSVTEKVNASC